MKVCMHFLKQSLTINYSLSGSWYITQPHAHKYMHTNTCTQQQTKCTLAKGLLFLCQSYQTSLQFVGNSPHQNGSNYCCFIPIWSFDLDFLIWLLLQSMWPLPTMFLARFMPLVSSDYILRFSCLMWAHQKKIPMLKRLKLSLALYLHIHQASMRFK